MSVTGANPVVGPSETPNALRLLLASAGTFVDLLEAYVGERIAVRKLAETTVVLDEAVDALTVPAGTTMLDRRVLLCRESSRDVVVDARSLIVPERLPGAVIDDLTNTGAPLGQVLVDHGVLHLRRHLATWREPPGEHAMPGAFPSEETLFCREYVIEVHAGPAVLITERLSCSGPWQDYELVKQRR